MALADGRVFHQNAVREPVTIPDQRALIHWTNGTERLVIETRFTGAGSNFAWVVPVPAKPVIEKASTGLFPTLEYLFRPELVHKVSRWYLGVLACLGLAYLLYAVKPLQKLTWKAIGACLLVCVCFIAGDPILGIIVTLVVVPSLLMVRFQPQGVYRILLLILMGLILFALFLPASSRSAARSMSSTRDGRSVEVLERTRVGAYETATIAGKDPLALDLWLRENGYAVSSNAGPVVADYVKQGWVFVAAKLVRDDAGQQTSTVHPLSFTFPVAQPIYPMRLTGVDSGPVSVELYVFGPDRATATNFEVKSCRRPSFPAAPDNWIRRKPKDLEIYASPLREWVQGAAVATKLSARLSPQELGRDVLLSWKPFEEKRGREFSHAGAFHYAANWSSGILLFGLLVWSVGSLYGKDRWLWKARWYSLAAAPVIGILIYAALEKVPVQLKRGHPGIAQLNLLSLSLVDADESPTASKIQKGIDSVIAQSPKYYPNDLLGGRIREEDSPGNYSIRETDEAFEMTGYDAAGAPHLLEKVPKK